MSKPVILKAADLPEKTLAELREAFDVLDFPENPDKAQQFLHLLGGTIRGIALRNTVIDKAFLALVPNVEIISSYTAGLDNVDVAAVHERGIVLKNTSHVLADDVADAAIGLALNICRGFVSADHFVRAGLWTKHKQFPLSRSLSAMTVGIVGLGTIGLEISRRLTAMKSRIAYMGPHKKPVNLPYYEDVTALARDCDMLILTCPLTDKTFHMINADVLSALGPNGYLVNIARGPVVDEQAMIAALSQGRIAGAALDVFEDEPDVPRELVDNTRTILTPHIASATVETRQAMADHVVSALKEHFGL